MKKEELLTTVLNLTPEDILEVSIRTSWVPFSDMDKPVSELAEEYRMLLSTGGPEIQLRGQLDADGVPSSASLEVRDWFKPWVTLSTPADEEKLLQKVLELWGLHE